MWYGGDVRARIETRGKSFKSWNSHLIHGLVSSWEQENGQSDRSGLHAASPLSWGMCDPPRELLLRGKRSPYSSGVQNPILNIF